MHISRIYPADRKSQEKLVNLLEEEGIRKDKNLDYTAGLFDDEERLVATGSIYSNTLRCLAVSRSHQGEGLMNVIVSHLMDEQFSRGNSHIFVYTKTTSRKFFESLGFKPIAAVDGQLVFLENRRNGFHDYLSKLKKESQSHEGPSSAIVMNANPFTLGHQYLVEKASADSDILHIFLVSEDRSLFPYEARRKLVGEGTKHLGNVIVHPTGPYLISNATFPSYFQKDEDAVIESHARLDAALFTLIASELKITIRYLGEEPLSHVTGIYNTILSSLLPESGIEVRILKRLEKDGRPVSASDVRNCLKEGNLEVANSLLPPSTASYLLSDEAKPVLERIRRSSDVRHY